MKLQLQLTQANAPQALIQVCGNKTLEELVNETQNPRHLIWLIKWQRQERFRKTQRKIVLILFLSFFLMIFKPVSAAKAFYVRNLKKFININQSIKPVNTMP